MRRVVLFIVLTKILVPTQLFADDQNLAQVAVCQNSGQVNLFRPDNVPFTDLSRHLAAEAIAVDLKAFCEWNRMDRMIDTLRLYIYDVKAMDLFLDEYRALKLNGNLPGAIALLKPYASHYNDDAWVRSLFGPAALKRTNIETFFSEVKKNTKNSSDLSLFSGEMVKALNTPFPQEMKLMDYELDQASPKPSASVRLAACAYLSLMDALSCSKAVEALYPYVDRYIPYGRGLVTTALPLVKNTLTNSRLTKGLQAAAVSLWKKIQNNSFSHEDNIFDEIRTALEATGLTKKEAEDEALQALGVIATGGPNFARRANLLDIKTFPICVDAGFIDSCNPNFVFLSAIAEGIAHADMLKMESAKDPSLYSLPQGYTFPCDAGKPYHFWMAAALTRELQKLGHKSGGARAAVYLSQMGYQTGRPYNAKTDELFNRPRFGTLENSSRIDLVLAAAGTRFGADVGDGKSSKPVSLQEALRQNVLAGGTRPNSKSPPEFVLNEQSKLQWADDMAPKQAFTYFK